MANLEAELARFEAELAGTNGVQVRDLFSLNCLTPTGCKLYKSSQRIWVGRSLLMSCMRSSPQSPESLRHSTNSGPIARPLSRCFSLKLYCGPSNLYTVFQDRLIIQVLTHFHHLLPFMDLEVSIIATLQALCSARLCRRRSSPHALLVELLVHTVLSYVD